jgi:hypothetical protein
MSGLARGPSLPYTNRSGGRGCGRRRETPRHARQHPPDPPAAPPGIAPCRTTPTGGSIGSPAEPARQAGGLCGAEADGADASGTNLPRDSHRACGIGLGRARGRLRLRPGLRFPAQPASVKAIGRAMSSCGSSSSLTCQRRQVVPPSSLMSAWASPGAIRSRTAPMSNTSSAPS